MRNFSFVTESILASIPKNGDHEQFISDIEWLLRDSLFRSPEDNEQWIRLTRNIKKHIPEPELPWQFEILARLNGLTVNQTKRLYKKLT